MAIITLEVSDELADALSHIGDRLPEWLTLSLQQPPVPASVYRDLLNFLASSPTAQEIAAFQPDPKSSATASSATSTRTRCWIDTL